MNADEIKAGLETLEKKEIIKTFPSLDLKLADLKDFLVEAVLNGEPTEEEKSEFKRILEEKSEPEVLNGEPTEEEKSESEQPPEENSAKRETEREIVKEAIYRVVYPIKEDGHLYKSGDKYEGENIERFLKGKQIRLVE